MIYVFGNTGQMGQALKVKAGVASLGRADADLLEPESCAAAILEFKPSLVLNAAAYTAVDAAEKDEAAAYVINGEAPGAMARACAKLAIPFVHISTDYVFDGTGTRAWRPEDPVAPINAYGRTKLAGENAVRAAAGTYAIIRTSWVFSANGNNFVKTMLRLGAERKRLTIVSDQIGGPTEAGDLAEAALAIGNSLQSDPKASGTYHFSGTPDVSWADFAREIFRQAGLSAEVVGIPTTEYPTPAARPANSRLDCGSIERFGISRPDWRQSLSTVLSTLQGAQ